jgi:N-acetyl-anhydromuramyl-L-alanine amidase AmpD
VAIVGQPSTFDLTPRRLLKLKPQPGEKFRWEAVCQEVPHWARRKKPEPKSGLIAADTSSLITLNGLETATGYKLVVRIAREK